MLGLSGTAAATVCDKLELGTLAGVQHSQWEESNANGVSLVRERGTLTSAGLQAAVRCSELDWTAQWTHSQGQRAYDGVTTTQAPLQTHSQLRAQALVLAAWLPLRQGWSLGSRLGYRQIQRNIASSGNVLGYPERFRYFQAALGARYQAVFGERLRLTASGWLGGGPGGHVAVDLPRADPLTLPLGASTLLELGLQLDGGQARLPGWAWQLGVTYRREQTRAGAPQLLTRNGVPVGVALQPAIVQQHLGSTVTLMYRF